MTRVKLRHKPISNGQESHYLDIYPPIAHPITGELKRKYFLHLHTYLNPKNNVEKLHNIETLKLVEYRKAERLIDIQNKNYDFLIKKRISDFTEFFQAEANKRPDSYNWQMAVRYFQNFCGKNLHFIDLDYSTCEQFKNFLLSNPSVGRYERKISLNTASSYFDKFRNTIKSAFINKYLLTDLSTVVKGIKLEETHRCFLFLNELQSMADAKCESQLVKKAGLFSALTGFRFSDIKNLVWGDIQGSNGNFYILYKQSKTGNAEYYPISDKTLEILGLPKDNNEKVFEGIKYDDVVKFLKPWLKNAGINKYFTFHGFRHTFATLQLASGTSIYTISKLLGHRNLKTTEIYTKIIDSVAREASLKIKLDFD